MGNVTVPPRSRNITQYGGLPNPHTLSRIPKLPPARPKPTNKQGQRVSKASKAIKQTSKASKPASKACKPARPFSKAIQPASKSNKASTQGRTSRPTSRQASPLKPASNANEFTHFTCFTYTGPSFGVGLHPYVNHPGQQASKASE